MNGIKQRSPTTVIIIGGQVYSFQAGLKVLFICPTIENYIFHLFQALTDQGNYQKADEMFEKAIKVEPDNATQYVHRG